MTTLLDAMKDFEQMLAGSHGTVMDDATQSCTGEDLYLYLADFFEKASVAHTYKGAPVNGIRKDEVSDRFFAAAIPEGKENIRYFETKIDRPDFNEPSQCIKKWSSLQLAIVGGVKTLSFDFLEEDPDILQVVYYPHGMDAPGADVREIVVSSKLKPSTEASFLLNTIMNIYKYPPFGRIFYQLRDHVLNPKMAVHYDPKRPSIELL